MNIIQMPMLTYNTDAKPTGNHPEEKDYGCTHSTPSEQKEEGEISTPFRLCNVDGTPLEIRIVNSNSNSDESSVEENDIEEPECIENDESEENEVIEAVDMPKDVLDEVEASPSLTEESSEEDLPSAFVSFIAIEKLRSQYPPLDEQMIIDRISQMFSTSERTPIEFSLIQKKKESNNQANEKLKALKEKKDTSLEKVRNEFNRVTEDNLVDVVDNLLAIKIEKVDDMKEIAGFVFEKAITEKLFLRVYTAIIGRLKKVWKTTEELNMPEKSQTCFFGVLMNYIVSRITDKQKWSVQADVSGLKGTRQKIEREIEDFETERLKRKARATGAVDLLLSMYIANIIGPSNLITVVNQLVESSSSAEHVEMIIMILSTATEKLVSNEKEAVVLQMVKFLKSNIKRHDGRVDFLIDSTIEKIQKHIRPIRLEQSTNMFASLVEEDTEMEEEPCEEDILYDYVSGLGSRLSGAASESDMMAIKKDVETLLQTRSNELFFTLLFAEIVSNYKFGDALRELFMVHLINMPGSLKGSLRNLKERLGMLAIDFPISTSKYAEFLCYLRGAELIDGQFFDNLKTNEFSKKSEQLQQKWRETRDPRLAVVFRR